MLIDFHLGQGSIVLRIKVRDSSVTTGAGLTGLTSASSGMIISTIADNEATATVYTVAASHVQTITTLGTFAAPSASNCRFKEVDATNHPGIYEVQIADARYAVSSAKSLLISLSGATNMVQTDVLIPLRSVDPYSATAFITGVNSLAPPSAWNTDVIQTGDSFTRLGAPAGASVSADVAAVNTKTTNLPPDPADASDIAAAFAAVLVTAMTEAYPADGATMSMAQFAYLIRSFLTDFSISGTTLTAKKVDGSTTSSTYTLNDATSPTAITRAS